MWRAPAAILIALTTATGAIAQTGRAWMDTSLSPDARADLLQAQMTPDESLQLLHGYYGANITFLHVRPVPPEYRDVLPGTAGYVPGIARLGIPDLIETDAGEGIANSVDMRPDDRATALPSGLAAAATWNPELVSRVGAVLGTEACNRGFNVVLDGGLNLARDAAGGRTFEYAGEDPLLAGTTAGAMVAGIQSQHVISTLKHFAFNDQETGRFYVDARIGESAARESDLLAFEIAIEKGKPGAIMCAYNRYNGAYVCENDFLLNKVLKQDWKFPGWILSDWGAVHSTVGAANAGLDQESASRFDGADFFATPLRQALADGTISEDRLRDMTHRILREMFAKGLFDYPPTKSASDMAADAAVAEQEAEEAITLLKNEGGILPLASKVRSIAIIGSHADLGVLSGAGSSQVLPLGYSSADSFPVGGAAVPRTGGMPGPIGLAIYDPPSPLSAMRAAFSDARIRFVEGENISEAVRLARGSEIAVIFAHQWRTEGRDVPDLSLRGNQDALINAVASANPRTVVVLETGGAVLMPWISKVPAVIEAWYPGSGGANAIARVLSGVANPSGRLPITFPLSAAQLPRPVIVQSNEVNYIEGSDVGYKWFERQNLQPLFPFGFGLSYTTFQISDLQAQGGKSITTSATVTNTGSRAGLATVEFYATPPGATKRLVGWKKIDLQPGESKPVDVVVDPRLLAHFDESNDVWRVQSGDYNVVAGFSSDKPSSSVSVALAESELDP